MVDTVTLGLVNNRLDEAVQEMQYSIFRTGYSTIIRESKDTSAGITTKDGEIISQKSLHTIHLGVFKPTVEAIYDYYDEADIEEGDIFLVNDPYVGGSPHSPDIIIANPVFYEGEIVAFTLNIAHKPDIGGLVPGTSSGEARELYHEGIQLPPVKYEAAGEKRSDIENIIRQNSRIPDTTIGDIHGQVGCTKVGERKLVDLFDEYGKETVLESFDEILESAKTQLTDRLNEWPQKTVSAEAFMDIPDDKQTWEGSLGDDERVRLALSIKHTDEGLVFDFTDSDDQTELPINVQPPLVRSLCYYGVIGLLDRDLPINGGIGDLVTVKTRKGSIVEPQRPAPVNSYIYGVNTLTNIILRALSGFNEETAVADASGNLGFSFGTSGADSSVQYEIIFSSYGGTSKGDGATGVSTHTMNIDITPIEILESEFPNTVDRFEVIPDSEGAGKHRGGFGLRREYTLESDQQFTYRPKISNVYPPHGIGDGEGPDFPARCYVEQGDQQRRLPTIADTQHLSTDDSVSMELPGGGGYGDPKERDPEKVREDYENGFITAERARTVYGVEVEPADADQCNTVSAEKPD